MSVILELESAAFEPPACRRLPVVTVRGRILIGCKIWELGYIMACKKTKRIQDYGSETTRASIMKKRKKSRKQKILR